MQWWGCDHIKNALYFTMESIQVKSSYKQSNYICETGSRDIPIGFLKDFNDKFKAWEVKRGLAKHTFNGPLRGAAKRSAKGKSSKK